MPHDAPAKAAERLVTSDLVGTLREKWPRLAMTLAASQAAWPAGRTLWARWEDRTWYTIKVLGGDDFWDELHEWVLSQLPPKDQRALIAWASRQHQGLLVAIGEDERPPAALRLRYDGGRRQVIHVAGHKIEVTVTDGSGSEERQWRQPEMTFAASSPRGRDALLAEMNQVLLRSHQRRQAPTVRMLDRWGDWIRLDDLPGRGLDSVILPDGQLDRMVADVGRFLAGQAEYDRRSRPWHRGHLYEGPPGTGKTSVARAVASHFGLDVWYLPLADVKCDSDLLQMVNRVGPRSMLLLEDVDVFHAATTRDDGKGLTLAGLLNTLDGIATPRGLLTILTTNTMGAIDPALIRPGRVDLVEHFGYATAGQASALFSRWYDQPMNITAPPVTADLAPAAIIGILERHPDDPAGAAGELFTAWTADRDVTGQLAVR